MNGKSRDAANAAAALTDLLKVIADPKAASALLDQLKAEQDKIAKATADQAAAREAAAKERAALAEADKTLKSNISVAETELANRRTAIATREKVVQESLEQVQDGHNQLAAAVSDHEAKVKAFDATVEETNKVHSRRIELMTEKDAALSKRETDVAGREIAVDNLKRDLEGRLAAIKAAAAQAAAS